MSDSKIEITPDLNVGELLDCYPQLEDVLIGIAPAFEKLRNPTLRRTVATLTTLRQAASVGNVSLGHMISALRTAAGQQEPWVGDSAGGAEGDAMQQQRPAWLAECTVELFDAREAIEAGQHPLPQVLAATAQLQPGQAFAIVTPFTPSPMIDKLREKGFRSWTEQKGPEHYVTHFSPVT